MINKQFHCARLILKHLRRTSYTYIGNDLVGLLLVSPLLTLWTFRERVCDFSPHRVRRNDVREELAFKSGTLLRRFSAFPVPSINDLETLKADGVDGDRLAISTPNNPKAERWICYTHTAIGTLKLG